MEEVLVEVVLMANFRNKFNNMRFKFSYLILLLFCSCSSNKSQEWRIHMNEINNSLLVDDIYFNNALIDSFEYFSLKKELQNIRNSKSDFEIKIVLDSTSIPFINIEEYTNFLLGLRETYYYDIDSGSTPGIVLICLFEIDREVMIRTNEVAKEKYSDAFLQHIVDSIFIPNFKQKQYSEGLSQGLKELKNVK